MHQIRQLLTAFAVQWMDEIIEVRLPGIGSLQRHSFLPPSSVLPWRESMLHGYYLVLQMAADFLVFSLVDRLSR